jgi:hypothetical protein
MSEIASESAFVAELHKISVPPGLERKWRILERLDGLENGCAVIFLSVYNNAMADNVSDTACFALRLLIWVNP